MATDDEKSTSTGSVTKKGWKAKVRDWGNKAFVMFRDAAEKTAVTLAASDTINNIVSWYQNRRK